MPEVSTEPLSKDAVNRGVLWQLLKAHRNQSSTQPTCAPVPGLAAPAKLAGTLQQRISLLVLGARRQRRTKKARETRIPTASEVSHPKHPVASVTQSSTWDPDIRTMRQLPNAFHNAIRTSTFPFVTYPS